MTEQTRRPDLFAAVGQHLTERQQAADEAARPEREAAEKQAAADAKLYGTAGWDALSDRRRQRAAHHTAQQAQGGGDDAA